MYVEIIITNINKCVQSLAQATSFSFFDLHWNNYNENQWSEISIEWFKHTQIDCMKMQKLHETQNIEFFLQTTQYFFKISSLNSRMNPIMFYFYSDFNFDSENIPFWHLNAVALWLFMQSFSVCRMYVLIRKKRSFSHRFCSDHTICSGMPYDWLVKCENASRTAVVFSE